MKSARPATIELWLIFSIAAHSVAVGVFLLFLPHWSASFGGWGAVSPSFFARQAGAFHLVVAVGYLHEYLRHRGVTLLILAKSTAVAFLLVAIFSMGNVAWAVPVSALADGLMALAVILVHRRALSGA